MYEYIKGKLVSLKPSCAIVEANNIGYKIFIPINNHNQISQIGTNIFLYISFIVREDVQTLYGFLEMVQRDLFEQLITISGVGPKVGMSIVGHLEVDHFNQAIINSDARIISQIPGIGKKTAQRLIIEMKDKLKMLTSDNFIKASNSSLNSTAFDAIKALINLGYNPIKAQETVDLVIKEEGEKNISDLISLALRKI